MDDTEFTQFEELNKLIDAELEKIVIQGINLHIHTSKASVAKRILDNRRQLKQVKAAQDMETVAKQLEKSHKELLSIVGGVGEVVKILDFLKNHWFPKQSIWIRVGIFLTGTVILGIVLNLIADAIAKFILHW